MFCVLQSVNRILEWGSNIVQIYHGIVITNTFLMTLHDVVKHTLKCIVFVLGHWNHNLHVKLYTGGRWSSCCQDALLNSWSYRLLKVKLTILFVKFQAWWQKTSNSLHFISTPIYVCNAQSFDDYLSISHNLKASPFRAIRVFKGTIIEKWRWLNAAEKNEWTCWTRSTWLLNRGVVI